MRGSILRRWWVLAAPLAPVAPGASRASAGRSRRRPPPRASWHGAAAPDAALFEVRAPGGMITGRVRLEAVSRDPEIGFVRWQAGDRSRTSGKPFEFFLDAGPVPEEKIVIATALDRERRPLYRIETLLNPGGRRIALQFVDAARRTGRDGCRARPRARVAAGRRGSRVRRARRGRPERRAGRDPATIRSASVDLAGAPAVLTARATTTLGRSAERSILLNARGLRASLDAHVVEQMVAVTKRGEPVEGLTAVGLPRARRRRRLRDPRGAARARREPRRRRVDRHVPEPPLRGGAAPGRREPVPPDARAARHGVPAAVRRHRRARRRLDDVARRASRRASSRLDEDPVPGTLLHAAIVDALYQLQGGDGARALLLVTDGNVFEDDLPEKEALAFARAGRRVPIFALALPWVLEIENPQREKDEDGNIVQTVTVTTAKNSRRTRPSSSASPTRRAAARTSSRTPRTSRPFSRRSSATSGPATSSPS